MKLDRPDRTCEDRVFHGISKEIKLRVRDSVLTESIHIDTDLFPLLKIPDRRISVTLRARPRYCVAAGFSVTYRAYPARPHVTLRVCEYFLICHNLFLLLYGDIQFDFFLSALDFHNCRSL